MSEASNKESLGGTEFGSSQVAPPWRAPTHRTSFQLMIRSQTSLGSLQQRQRSSGRQLLSSHLKSKVFSPLISPESTANQIAACARSAWCCAPGQVCLLLSSAGILRAS